MKCTSLIFLNLLLTWTLGSSLSFAEDDVHFGTIFVEDIEYEHSEENQNINHLTDSSVKQQQLETLYKSEIGTPNEKLKKLDFTPRGLASKKDKDSVTQQVGVLRNSELPKKIVYFLELRSFAGNQSKSIHRLASPTSPQVMRLQPGEMIKVIDTPDQYIHKMRMDRDNQGLWKAVSTREQDVQDSQVYYDWKNFDTITSHDFPIELDILVPYGRNSTPVFSKPGAWTWRDCGLSEDLCIDNVDLHTKAYLFDATMVDVKVMANSQTDYRLFYKVGYQIKDKDGNVQHRVGWLPSQHARRKISQLPKSLLATRTPNSFGAYESDEERLSRLKKYYVFDSNLNSKNRTLNRWLAATPGNTTEVFFQNLAIEGLASVNTFHMEQSFIPDQAFDQTGVSVGAGIFAPIFIDLEIQGTFNFTVPMSATEEGVYEKAYLFRAEQWLLYTTPLAIGSAPFKFGFGGYYQTMFASNQDFGFKSLVGFQMKALFESESYWAGFRYGPTGQDFSFRFENRELGAEIGVRLNPARKYESWSIYGDLSDTSFSDKSSEQSTKFQIISVGIRKQF